MTTVTGQPGGPPTGANSPLSQRPALFPARPITEREWHAWTWSGPARRATGAELLGWVLLRWRVDPGLFWFEALRGVPQPYQLQLLLDLFDAPAEVYAWYNAQGLGEQGVPLDATHPKSQVLAPSGHGLGKTRVEAVAIWLHKLTHKFSMQLCTAPSSDQLTGRLWGELRKLYRRMRKGGDTQIAQITKLLADEWEILGSSIVHKDPAFGDWLTVARTARAEQPESLQGAHALDADDEFGDLAEALGEAADRAPSGGMLVILEEASGVPDIIRETLEGALSEEGAKMLGCGNPTRPDGWFAEDIRRTDRYAVHPLDCRMSSREEVRRMPYRDTDGKVHHLRVRGFVSPRYWEDILAEVDGDEEADRFKVRVRGIPPTSALEQCIKTHWVEQAQARSPDEASAREAAIIGLDFGVSSDKHAGAVRQGHNLLHGEEWLPKDTPEQITTQAAFWAIETQRIYAARYIIGDANGVGRGAMEMLWRYFTVDHPEHGVQVIFFNSGERALDPTRYYRKRDQMWHGRGRPWFASPRCYLPSLPGLKKQLTLPGYAEDSSRRIQVESKKDITKRTGEPSGNLADAVLMTLMVHVPEEKPATKEPPRHPTVFEEHFRRWRRQREREVFI